MVIYSILFPITFRLLILFICHLYLNIPHVQYDKYHHRTTARSTLSVATWLFTPDVNVTTYIKKA